MLSLQAFLELFLSHKRIKLRSLSCYRGGYMVRGFSWVTCCVSHFMVYSQLYVWNFLIGIRASVLCKISVLPYFFQNQLSPLQALVERINQMIEIFDVRLESVLIWFCKIPIKLKYLLKCKLFFSILWKTSDLMGWITNHLGKQWL